MTAIKLDENLSGQHLQRAREVGHDTESVRSQNLSGASDQTLFERCREERRVLVTLDLDFSSPMRFSPLRTSGTVILRPHRPSPTEIDALLDEALQRLHDESVEAQIWIVEPGRVRIYRSWDADQEL